jgi:ornithine cyclodeaminase
MTEIAIRFLSRAQVEALAPGPAELVHVVGTGLAAHGRREVVMPPKAHLHLDHLFAGHFNILPGYVGPIDRAGIKVVGDYVENWRHGLPSELALLTLYEPQTGRPLAIMDATALTWMRTGAVTCVGALHLARRDSRVVTHIGARGTAFSNLRLLAAHFPLEEIRLCSHRSESRTRPRRADGGHRNGLPRRRHRGRGHQADRGAIAARRRRPGTRCASRHLRLDPCARPGARSRGRPARRG